MPPLKRNPSSEELRRVRDRQLDLKRMSGELSCSDCRRLKLKCDRKIPCSSCVRRGVEDLCPFGTVRRGGDESARVVITSDLERCERRVTLLTERIRALEDALALESEARGGSGSHPLLAEDLLAIKAATNGDGREDKEREVDDGDQLLSAFGTLSIDENQSMRYIGPAGSENVLVMEALENSPSRHLWVNKPSDTDLSPEVIRLSELFPFAPTSLHEKRFSSSLAPLIAYLPSFGRATALYEAFFTNLAWTFFSVDRSQFVSEILPLFYPDRKPIAPTMVKDEQAHELGLLFALFSCGSVADLTKDPINDEAERFSILAKAAMGIRSVMHGASLTAVQATHLMASYEIYSGRKPNMEDAWRLFSLAGTLAAAIGLHRDPSRFRFEPKMIERRRRVFWEIYAADAWSRLESGRPSIFRSNDVDCEFPSWEFVELGKIGELFRSVVQWAYGYLRDVTIPCCELMCSARPLKYRDILDLDRKIRDFPTRPHAKCVQCSLCSEVMETEFASMYPILSIWDKEEPLLYIHRNLFARAILDYPDNPMGSPFSASFLTTYRCAVTILRVSRENMEKAYSIMLRFWQFWSLCLSCGVVVGSVASLGNSVSFATSALFELECAIALFEKYNGHIIAKHGLPLFRRIRERAISNLCRPDKGQSTSGDAKYTGEELLILRGTTRIVEQRSSTVSDAAAPPEITGPSAKRSGLSFASPDHPLNDTQTDIFQPASRRSLPAGNLEQKSSGNNPTPLLTHPPIPVDWLTELINVPESNGTTQEHISDTMGHQQDSTFDWLQTMSGSAPEVPSTMMDSTSSTAGAPLYDVFLETSVSTDDWGCLIQQSGFSNTAPFDFSYGSNVHPAFPQQNRQGHTTMDE